MWYAVKFSSWYSFQSLNEFGSVVDLKECKAMYLDMNGFKAYEQNWATSLVQKNKETSMAMILKLDYLKVKLILKFLSSYITNTDEALI